MILMLKFIDGKKVMIDFDDVVAVEEVAPEGTLIILIRDGIKFEIVVSQTVDEIYDLLLTRTTMIVKDVEDGLSNFPEGAELAFEVDGKPVELVWISDTVSTPIERGNLTPPTELVVMGFTYGTVQGKE